MQNGTDNNATKQDFAVSETQLVITIVFLSATSLCAIFGNALVCAAFATNRVLRQLTNYYVVSLAISDILVGLFNIPLYMFFYGTSNELVKTPTRLNMYEAFIMFDILCGSASIWNMTAISIDRCTEAINDSSSFTYIVGLMAVKYPNRYRSYMKKPALASFLIVSVWTIAAFVASLRLVFKKEEQVFPFNIVVFVLSFAVPFLIIVPAYFNIYFVVSKHAKWSSSVLIEIKLARTLSIVITCFIFCWGPFSALNLIAKYCNKIPSCKNDILIATPYLKLVQYVSSCFNPIIYTIRNREFRFTFHKLIFRCSNRNGKYVINKREKRLDRFSVGCTTIGTSRCELEMSDVEIAATKDVFSDTADTIAAR